MASPNRENQPTNQPAHQAAQVVTAEELKNGDPQAFARLFEQNRDRLLALAYRMTASTTEAQDVVQDAFVSILVHHEQFRGAALPSTWAYRVTVNAALMRLRTRRRKGAASLDALPDDVKEGVVHGHRDDGTAPALDPDRQTKQALLDKALSRLSPLDHEIVRLRHGEDVSTEDVGAITGLSASAVKTRLHRARARLGAVVDLLAAT